MKKYSMIAIVLVLTLTMAGCRRNKQNATTDTTGATTSTPTSTAATTPGTSSTRPSTSYTEPSMDMTLPDFTDGTVGNGTAGDDNGILPDTTDGQDRNMRRRPY
jgi:hypothetical protein